jgi:hypothetical protein
MITVRVENFRGCGKAEIVCDRIALVAGRNAAGKSSLAQAVGAALTGETLPFGLASKGEAKRLVKTGAETARVEIVETFAAPGSEAGGVARVEWPSCTATNRGDPPYASAYAAGLASLARMAPKDRAAVMASYLQGLDPTVTLANSAALPSYPPRRASAKPKVPARAGLARCRPVNKRRTLNSPPVSTVVSPAAI